MTKQNAFMKIPIKLLIESEMDFSADIFIQLSKDKVLKLTHADDLEKKTILRRYQERGIKFILVSKKDFDTFMKHTTGNLQNKLFNQDLKATQQMTLLSDCYGMLRDSLMTYQISSVQISMAQEVVDNACILINSQPNIANFLMNHKNENNKRFIKSAFVAYISCCIVSDFDWGSNSIKEKCTLAALLCDMLLDDKASEEIEKHISNNKILPKNTNHPREIVELLKKQKYLVSQETLTIIEQHHELPGGQGFPLKLDHQRITTLSAVNIISAHFVDLIIERNFNPDDKELILYELKEKFNLGSYKKAFKAFENILL